MDEGRFGERHDDRVGLGEGSVNPQKFPHGLKPLIDYINSLGMKFGLWLEPEMVNPESRRHRNPAYVSAYGPCACLGRPPGSPLCGWSGPAGIIRRYL